MDDVRPLQAAAAEAGSGTEENLEEIVKKTDFEILEAALTEDALYDRCLTARQYGVASVIVRPCDADSAMRFLSLGVVGVASVVSHPYGGSNTAVKIYEARDLLRRGVKQLIAYPNPGKMLSRQFQHQEIELLQLAEACTEKGAVLKVVADNALLDEEMKIVICRMAKRVGAHFIISTEPRDFELLRKHTGDRVQLEAGGVRTIEEARQAFAAGCTRVSTPDAAGLLAAKVS